VEYKSAPLISCSSGVVVAGTRNPSLAQAPKSIFLQRSLQKGLAGLDVAYTLSPPQLGQRTTLLAVCEVEGEALL